MVLSSRDVYDLLHIIEWDVRKLRKQTLFVVMRTTWFILQVIVFGYTLSYLVRSYPGFNYYDFYLLGVFISLVYSVSISRGYELADEFDEGIIEYHLALPVKRSVLALGRVLGGSISSFLFTLPMYVLVLAIVGVVSLTGLAVSLIMIYVFSMGVVGFVVTIVLSVKSTDATDILIGVIDALLIRLSTVFYPAPVLMKIMPYYYASIFNPVSSISDFLRNLFLPEYAIYTSLPPEAQVAYIVGLAVGFSYLALYIVSNRLEAGGWK
ncbi:ABC transporter [Thermogladius sp. 4427co]|uniref:ABC transporter n=1 Tax=Thermogladius sp. 4427co TaxID=3450718 RepID=UPI003F7B271F